MITLTISSTSATATFKVKPHEYRNLMALIADKLELDDFGQCGGMGRCGTCAVRIKSIKALCRSPANEDATLKKMGLFNTDLRLSCQLPLNQELDLVTISLDVY